VNISPVSRIIGVIPWFLFLNFLFVMPTVSQRDKLTTLEKSKDRIVGTKGRCIDRILSARPREESEKFMIASLLVSALNPLRATVFTNCDRFSSMIETLQRIVDRVRLASKISSIRANVTLQR